MFVPGSFNAEDGRLGIAELRARLSVLEKALVVALSQLASTDAGAADQVAAREGVSEVGQLIDSGHAPTAARRYRELFGVTWDEAHAAVRRWQPARREELVQRLWLKRWVDAQGEQ